MTLLLRKKTIPHFGHRRPRFWSWLCSPMVWPSTSHWDSIFSFVKWKGNTLPHRAERVQKLMNNIYIVCCVWTKPDEKQGLILRVLSFKRRIHQVLSPEPCYVPQLGHRWELSAFRLGRCGQDTGNQCAADGAAAWCCRGPEGTQRPGEVRAGLLGRQPWRTRWEPQCPAQHWPWAGTPTAFLKWMNDLGQSATFWCYQTSSCM